MEHMAPEEAAQARATAHKSLSGVEHVQSSSRQEYTPGVLVRTRIKRLFFSAHRDDDHTMHEIRKYKTLYYFSSSQPEMYKPFCGDNGPVDIKALVEVCELIDRSMRSPQISKKRALVFYTYMDAQCVTNTVLLVCAYVMLTLRCTPEEALAEFVDIPGLPIVPFHDASYNKQTFGLTVLDVLKGLHRACSLKWFDRETFDASIFEALYEQPTHDMSIICPRFVAFATPKDQADLHSGARPVSVHSDIFRRIGVSDIVRLNEQLYYNDREFSEDCFKFHSLEFEDCTAPSLAVVQRFLKICDSAKGMVAVHCLAGMGRTGTLLGCYFIRRFGFTAAEAIGYLRLMRSGSVIGPQQNLLQEVEFITRSHAALGESWTADAHKQDNLLRKESVFSDASTLCSPDSTPSSPGARARSVDTAIWRKADVEDDEEEDGLGPLLQALGLKDARVMAADLQKGQSKRLSSRSLDPSPSSFTAMSSPA
uniref:protein-tyrosine-phosphatase n=1 Tax=Hemiselmis andersenii TaxID=464988 RepID=A0A6U5C017_HEMAN|mmetsp:Transcript_42835/g.99484  ORF Transcript_42835/g.99484 Transcript_42835/m.99484 type:complete len:480 (-) Transcript_42835:63-1502(-)